MITIHLHNLIFNSNHGIYADESVVGNRFELDIDISFENNGPVKQISDTLNYGEIYETVSVEMQKATGLLEVLADRIVDAIVNKDNRVKLVKITIFKCHPPLKKFEGKVGVTIEKKF